jgi:hypothetical protein
MILKRAGLPRGSRARYRRVVEMRKYPDMAAVLNDDEIGLITLWQAHTAVRCRCNKDSGCEARQVLEDAISKIRLLQAGQRVH